MCKRLAQNAEIKKAQVGCQEEYISPFMFVISMQVDAEVTRRTINKLKRDIGRSNYRKFILLLFK